MDFLPDTDPRHRVWKGCESPIEQILCCNLFARLGCKAIGGPYDFISCVQQTAGDPAAFLFSQHRVGRFRADFLLVLIGDDSERARVILECDGADYHASPDRCAYDAARDAEIVVGGYSILRFTGSEIVGDIDLVLARITRLFEADGVPARPARDCGWYAAMLAFEARSRSETLKRRQWRERLLAEIEEAARPPFREDSLGIDGFI